MANSFIEFNTNGFWARDGFVEAFQLLLFEEINNQYGNTIEWLTTYKSEIAMQSLPLIYGGMSLCLDETLISQNRKDILLKCLDRIKSRISSDENYLTGRHLNMLRQDVRQFLVRAKKFKWDEEQIAKQVKDGAYGDELPQKIYLSAFELLSQLISGQLNFKADTPITYWDE